MEELIQHLAKTGHVPPARFCFYLSNVTGLGSLGSQDQRIVRLLYESHAHRSHKDLEAFAEVHAWIRIYHTAGIFASDSDDFVAVYIKRKTLSRVPFEVGAEEVVSALKKIPSVVHLDAW